jgi:acetolactate synthase-1/3 small subunit
VRCDVRHRADVLQVVDLFRALVVDVSPDSLVIEAVGTPEKLEALLAALAVHDVREIVQSGTVAIGRGARSITERALDRVIA